MLSCDFGIPLAQVEQVIRSTGCVEIPNWLLYRGIQFALDLCYPETEDWLRSHFHGLEAELQTITLELLAQDSTGPEMNRHYQEIGELYTDLKEGSL